MADWPIITRSADGLDAEREIFALHQQIAQLERRLDHVEEMAADCPTCQARDLSGSAIELLRELDREEKYHGGLAAWLRDLRRRDEVCQQNRSRIGVGAAIGVATTAAAALLSALWLGVTHMVHDRSPAASPPASSTQPERR